MIFYPYVTIYPAVQHRLRSFEHRGVHVDWCDLSTVDAPSDEAYYWALAERWTRCAQAQEDLVIIEQDVLPSWKQYQSFLTCPLRYCGYHTWLGVSYGRGLGANRFRWEVLDAYDIPTVIHDYADGSIPPRAWQRLDRRINDALSTRGVALDCHGVMAHLHPYPIPDPLARWC